MTRTLARSNLGCLWSRQHQHLVFLTIDYRLIFTRVPKITYRYGKQLQRRCNADRATGTFRCLQSFTMDINISVGSQTEVTQMVKRISEVYRNVCWEKRMAVVRRNQAESSQKLDETLRLSWKSSRKVTRPWKWTTEILLWKCNCFESGKKSIWCWALLTSQ